MREDHPLERLLFSALASLFVSDDVGADREKKEGKVGRLEMSDFEKFGLICAEWLDAAKENTSDEEDN